MKYLQLFRNYFRWILNYRILVCIEKFKDKIKLFPFPFPFPFRFKCLNGVKETLKNLLNCIEIFLFCYKTKLNIDKCKLIPNIQIEVLRAIQTISLDQAILATLLDSERGCLALGLSIEQLEEIKGDDVVYLSEAKKYFNKLNHDSRSIPQSLLSMNVDDEGDYSKGSLKILLLADTSHRANVVQDYINSFKLYSTNNVKIWNPINTTKKDMDFSLDSYDAIIIHYSICVLYDLYIPQYLLELIVRYEGLKVHIIQDEFRWVNRMANRLESLGIDIIISSLSTENIDKVYHHFGLRNVDKYHSLPGYIPEYLLQMSPPEMGKREYNLTYRGRDLPYHLGKIAQEKSNIEKQFIQVVNDHALKLNLKSNEKDRIYGAEWINLIQSSKAVLGVEGGVSIFDFDELVTMKVSRQLMLYPNSTFDNISEKVLVDYEGNVIHKTITPRIFEAICLRAANVLYPGEYSNVLKPWTHYIPFERDGVNIKEIVELLKDNSYLEELTEKAYQEIALNPLYHYKTFIRKLDYLIWSKLR